MEAFTQPLVPKIGTDWWRRSAWLLAGLTCVPTLVILSSFLAPDSEIWSHMWQNTLPSLMANTFWLVAGVGLGTLVLGVSLGWLVGACEFPGRRFFSWALVLPLAVPTYVLAFIFLGLMDFAGPVQSALRMIPGLETVMLEVRTTPFVVLVLSLALYPYVFALSRAAFITQGRSSLEAARTLGLGPTKAFWRVALPQARPWIAGGLALVVMETLADFGAVSIFNFDTFTTAIYKAWFGFFSLQAAAQLASILVVLAFALVLGEESLRTRMRFYETGKSGSAHSRLKLKGSKAWLACGICGLVFGLAFLAPMAQLIWWSMEVLAEDGSPAYLGHVSRTLLLGLSAGLLTCMGAVILTYAKRRSPGALTRGLCKASTMGYALPGTVLAVGVFLPVAWLDNGIADLAKGAWGIEPGPLLQGTLFIMLIAYLVRFMATGFSSIDAGIQRISPSLDEAASLSGIRGLRLMARVHLPLLQKGLLVGFILVMVDVIKEMPITLMTRPFGWDTLAVKIFELTSEGEWERAALPGLYLVLTGIIPVVFLTRQSEN